MQSSPTKGILFVTIGSPNAPTPAAVRSFLKQFLSDARVINLPSFWRFCLVYGLILPFRSKKVAQKYTEIWAPTGSPQKINSQRFLDAIQAALKGDFITSIAYQYDTPSIENEIDKMLDKGVEQLYIFPLFPQYTSAVTGSIFEAALKHLSSKSLIPEFHLISQFYQEDFYILAWVNALKKQLFDSPPYDAIVFSYHGIPFSQLNCPHHSCQTDNPLTDKKCTACQSAGSCYYHQCQSTTQQITSHFRTLSPKILTCYQSRFSKTMWLTPYLPDTLNQLAKEGCKRVLMVVPSFTFDGLETLFEVDIEEKEQFLLAGGEVLDRLSCFNDNRNWINGAAEFIQSKCI